MAKVRKPARKRTAKNSAGQKRKKTTGRITNAAGRKAAAKKKVPSRRAGARAVAKSAGKKKPTKKSAKKKAAKKKPAVPRRRPTHEARLAQPAAELRAPETPRPVAIPGAWPFPMGNRS